MGTLDGLVAFDQTQNATAGIEVLQYFGQLMIHIQTVTDCFSRIVLADPE